MSDEHIERPDGAAPYEPNHGQPNYGEPPHDDSGDPPTESPPPLTTGSSGGYREITLAALVLAFIIGAVMNASITYAGLKIGFTLGGSAIAAVLGFGVLRGLLRRGTILETNICQTVASAVNTSNSGIIFTVPVLFLLGYSLTWKDADFWLITLACVGGALLGCAFIIPLRKQMIDIERLRFPTGMGVAAILKSPGAGPKKAVLLLIGMLLGAVIYLPVGLQLIQFPVDSAKFSGAEQRGITTLLTEPDTWDRLDELVLNERITRETAQQTRDMQGWIVAAEAPAGVLAYGEVLIEQTRATEELRKAREAVQCENPDPADVQAVEDWKTRLEELEAQAGELEPGADGYPTRICRAAFEASGDAGWESLRSRESGWASVGVLGYQDLQFRLQRFYKANSSELHEKVDRDQNGQPDLVLTDDTVDVGRLFGLPDQFQLIFAIAPFALGAGFITGRAGLMVLAGGILAYFVLTPVAFSMGWMPNSVDAVGAPDYGFGAFNRPLGIGLLLGGALAGVVASAPAIREALRSIASSRKIGKGGRDELGLGVLVVAVIGAVALLFLAADIVGNKPVNTICPVTGDPVDRCIETSPFEGYQVAFATDEARATWQTQPQEARDAFLSDQNAKRGWLAGLSPHLRALVIALIGAVWIWLAGMIIAQCTGMTDWSPISGMALLTVVLIMLLAGSGAVVGAVLIGAALCVAITLAADMMADLRTGHLVGGIPRRQQSVELMAVGIGPVIAMLTVLLIVAVNQKLGGPSLGPGSPLGTEAPQAQALQAVITGVRGGEMPYMLYGLGALLGGLLGLGSFAGLGVLVGLSMYLPFMYIATYGIGCIVNMIISAIKGRPWAEEWGIPFAAGLVVGESILALVINAIVLLMG